MSHFIVCGMGQVGFRVASLLVRLGEQVTVITLQAREEWLKAAQHAGVKVIVGDARSRDHLEKAGIGTARALIACADQDLANIEVAMDAKALRPDMRVVVRLFDQILARQLEETLGLEGALAMSVLAAPAFASAAFGEQVASTFSIDDNQFVVGRFDVASMDHLRGLDLEKVVRDYGVAPLLHMGADSNVCVHPPMDLVLGSLDRIGAVGRRGTFVEDQGSGVPPARKHSWLAILRALYPTHLWHWARGVWKNTPIQFRAVFLAINGLTLVSVFIFQFGMGLSLWDALYFVVTTFTTTGYGDISPKDAALWLKLYACAIMVLGSLSIAVLYSILTDYIVTTRFQQLSGRQKIPDEEHVVVVGVGNVGYRVIKELERLGAKIVAVDRDDSSDLFQLLQATTACVVGDARDETVLERAGIENATAVIAVTQDDAVNLGVGLAARKVNPKARVVLRIFDAQFAAKIQESLHIEAALSASLIATPVFVASALFSNVATSFVLGDTLFALVVEEIPSEWVGKKLSEAGEHNGMKPLFRTATHRELCYAALDEAPLAAGEKVLFAAARPLRKDPQLQRFIS